MIQEITVNPALIAPSILVSGKSYDQGETVEITTGLTVISCVDAEVIAYVDGAAF